MLLVNKRISNKIERDCLFEPSKAKEEGYKQISCKTVLCQEDIISE